MNHLSDVLFFSCPVVCHCVTVCVGILLVLVGENWARRLHFIHFTTRIVRFISQRRVPLLWYTLSNCEEDFAGEDLYNLWKILWLHKIFICTVLCRLESRLEKVTMIALMTFEVYCFSIYNYDISLLFSFRKVILWKQRKPLRSAPYRHWWSVRMATNLASKDAGDYATFES